MSGAAWLAVGLAVWFGGGLAVGWFFTGMARMRRRQRERALAELRRNRVGL